MSKLFLFAWFTAREFMLLFAIALWMALVAGAEAYALRKFSISPCDMPPGEGASAIANNEKEDSSVAINESRLCMAYLI